MRGRGERLPSMIRALLAGPLVACSACAVPVASIPEPAPQSTPGFDLGAEQRCDGGPAGIDRLTDEASLRGLGFEMDPPPTPGFMHRDPMGGGVVLTDLDADGDIDVVVADFPWFPAIHVNDGTGVFTRSTQPAPPLHQDVREVGFFGAADFTGDGLPELVLHGAGFTALSENLGDLQFGPLEMVHSTAPDDPRGLVQTGAYGDVDGDGDLDMLLPVVHAGGGGGGPQGDGGNTALPDPGFDLLYINEGDQGWRLSQTLSPLGEPGHAQVALMTDFDLDGDPDLLVPSEFGDRSERTALYRNDGLDAAGDPVLINVAPELFADIDPGAMGVASYDANGDGLLDYCVSSVGPPQCLMSLGDGTFVEGATALGLVVPDSFDRPEWSSYSVEFVDLDNDSFMDAAVSAGPPNRDDPDPDHPDALYRGTPDGLLEEVTTAVGFGDLRRHYALASADLDRDGFPDLVVTGTQGPPRVWMNRCGPGAWLDLDFEGVGANAEAYGVMVHVRAGGRTHVRELHSLRAVGQGPSELHFGLGDAETADEVSVRWPDGARSVFYDMPLRRRVTVTHPDRVGLD